MMGAQWIFCFQKVVTNTIFAHLNYVSRLLSIKKKQEKKQENSKWKKRK